MLGSTLHICSQSQDFLLRPARIRQGTHVGQSRAAKGQRACLVDDHGIHLRGLLQVLAALDEDSVAGRAPNAGHDGYRDTDHERAWAADDQQGQGELRVVGDQADQNGADHDGRRVPATEFLQEGLGFRAVILGVLDTVNDLGKSGIRADVHGLDA